MKKTKSVLLLMILLFACALSATACDDNPPKLVTPDGLKIEGTTLTWNEVENSLQYKVDIGGVQQSTRENSYSLKDLNCKTTYTIKVMAIGDNTNFRDSNWSNELKEETSSTNFKHTLGEWFISTSPTCYDVGTETKSCVRCDHTEHREAAALGHDMLWTVTTEPTITEDGIEKEFCSRCNEEGDEREAYATGTPGLTYILIKEGTEYTVSKGTSTAEHVIIPSYHNRLPVTAVNSGGFSYYDNLKSIIIPDIVNEIGKSAFNGCEKLEELTLPFVGKTRMSAGVEGVFGHIFGFSSNQQTGTISQNHTATASYYYFIPTTLKKVTITDANGLSYGAFNNCTMLTSISINSTGSKINDIAFKGSSNLTSIIITGLISEVGTSSFENCTSLTNVELPEGTETIGYTAFKNCSSLKVIVLPKGVVTLRGQAFINCSALEYVVLPRTLYRIGVPQSGTSSPAGESEVFKNCGKLKSIVIPISVMEIVSYQNFESTAVTIFIERESQFTGWYGSWLQGSGASTLYGCKYAENENYLETVSKKANKSGTNFNAPYRHGYKFLGLSETKGGPVKYSDFNTYMNEGNNTNNYYTVWEKL